MVGSDRWPELLPADPRPWLLASDDPSARWVTLTQLLDVDPRDVNAVAAHNATISAPSTERIIKMLNGWRPGDGVTLRDARFRPNVLNLLAEMGVGPDDDDRIRTALTDFLHQRSNDGRFLTPRRGGTWEADWCDHCAVTDARLHLGEAGDEAAVKLILDEFTITREGRGWGHEAGGSVEFCPVETLLALRVLSAVHVNQRPRRIRDAVRTLLKLAAGELGTAQRESGDFIVMRWPPYGYCLFAVLDVAGRYPDVWEGPRARPVDRGHLVALAAAFTEANFDEHGAVVVHRPSIGFATFPMARRHCPSAMATASACVVLRRLEPLVEDILSHASRKTLVTTAH